MCIAIYLALLGLSLFLTGYTLEQYALSVEAGAGEWMLVAIGWELLGHLWPLLVTGVVMGSGVTFFVLRRLSPRSGTGAA